MSGYLSIKLVTIRKQSIIHSIGMIVMVAASVSLIPFVGSKIATRARRILGETARERLLENNEVIHPILFLRSKEDGATRLEPSRL